jgi:hypothetical protein
VITQVGCGQSVNNRTLNILLKDKRKAKLACKGWKKWSDGDRNTAISMVGGGQGVGNGSVYRVLLAPGYYMLKKHWKHWSGGDRNTAIVQNGGGQGGSNQKIYDSLYKKAYNSMR